MSFFRNQSRSLAPLDIKLLCYVFEHRTVLLQQIQRDLFPDVSRPVVSRRLARMIRFGALKRAAIVRNLEMRALYQLGPRAKIYLDQYYPLEVERETQGSSSIHHDLDLVDIVSHLRSLSSVEAVLTENMLQSCSNYTGSTFYSHFAALNSDGVLIVKGSGGSFQVALEYERTHKNKKRYQEKFRDYYARTAAAGIFYICRDEFIKKLLIEIDNEVRGANKSKFFFHSMKNDSFQPKKVIFRSPTGQFIEVS